jgi:Fe-S-cluster containining protein
MREIENLKKVILEEYPRLDLESKFTFQCHKSVACFNDCCGDVNIFLTPYDILRLKNRLKISSGEFLSKYTISPFDKNLRYPVVLLKMEENERKSCPFVSPDGCLVYTDRPWSCRMYPLGLASPKSDGESLDKEFYFLLQEGVCKGFHEKKQYTVAEWIKDQGVDQYTEMGELFKDIALHEILQKGEMLSPEKIEMFFMAAYDFDRFRDFVFNSSFLKKFDVDERTQEQIREDDAALLKFSFKWLRFALFGEKTMTIRREVLEAEKRKHE